MGLQSAHVFASHIGHTGKSTLCFQMSCYYAVQHGQESVLVMDLAEEGDLTKRMLGGVDAAASKIEDLFGSVFRLVSDAKSQSSGLTSWFRSGNLDITKHAVRVNDHNGSVPANIFLVSSGAWERTEEVMPDDLRQTICSKIRSSLEASETTWKLFCDTDGDRRPSPFTLLGYGLCPLAVVPLHLSKADLDRTETMLYMLNDLRVRGVISTRVSFVVWNMVKSLKDEPSEHNGLRLPFTPSKVSLDILQACNKRLLATVKDIPDLFVHKGDVAAEFVRTSTVVLRQLADNVLKPSEELGQPFVQMYQCLQSSGKKSIKFRTPDGIDYEAKSSVVEGVDTALDAIQQKLEALALDGPPKGGA